jgi:hypothetical protein
MEPDTHQALSLHQPAQALKQFFSIFLDEPQAHRDRYQHAKHAPGEILTRDPTVRAAYSRALKKRAVENNLNTSVSCAKCYICVEGFSVVMYHEHQFLTKYPCAFSLNFNSKVSSHIDTFSN